MGRHFLQEDLFFTITLCMIVCMYVWSIYLSIYLSVSPSVFNIDDNDIIKKTGGLEYYALLVFSSVTIQAGQALADQSRKETRWK